MSEIQKHLETLELPPGANWDEVTRAYRELIKIWHPDRFANDERLRARAEQKSKQLNEAVRQLRRHYRRTQFHRRSEINQAVAAARKATVSPERPQKNSRVYQTPLQERYRPKTSSSAIYQSLARKRRRVSRLTHFAAFTIFILSIAIFGTLGLPSKPTLIPGFSTNEPPPEGREVSDYRIVSLKPQAPQEAPKAGRTWTPEERPILIEAAANCKIGIMQDLIRKGHKLDDTDANGDTALAWAARTNCAAAARLLLQSGADPHTIAKNGFTPKDWALWAKNTTVLKLLDK